MPPMAMAKSHKMEMSVIEPKTVSKLGCGVFVRRIERALSRRISTTQLNTHRRLSMTAENDGFASLLNI